MLEQRNHRARSSVPREYCKANQKLLPWKWGKKPNHRESELRPHLSPSDPPSSPLALALSAIVGL